MYMSIYVFGDGGNVAEQNPIGYLQLTLLNEGKTFMRQTQVDTAFHRRD